MPSRMNIGQVLELHLGMAARKLGIHISTPVFDGARDEDIWAAVKEAGMLMMPRPFCMMAVPVNHLTNELPLGYALHEAGPYG